MMTIPTLVHLLHYRATEQPDKLAYTFLKDGEIPSQQLTYRELDQQARAIATQLQETGKTGDRVLLIYSQSLEFLAAFFGCLYAGIVAVPTPSPDASDSCLIIGVR